MTKKDKIERKKKSTKGQEVMKSLDKENNISMSKAITVLLVVIIIIVIVYFVAAIVMGEITFKKNDKVATIQYENILAGSTFKQHDKEYIVVYYDFKGNDASEIDSSISTYKSVTSSKALYKVDLSLKQNKIYTTDKNSNKKPIKATDLKIKGSTLLHIKDNKVITYIEGIDNIKDYLK